ncbi:MAG TPA: hypothetical protein VNE42_04750 [Acidimicrobiales bacterium]|nr:hypothetical protein [Acidimicrobiales bacterium]
MHSREWANDFEITETIEEVFIFGAGFSISLSEVFPDTDDLGNTVITRAHIKSGFPEGGFKHGNFEAWLSRISVEQPYLSESNNLWNATLSSIVRRNIVEVLQDAQREMLGHPAKTWFCELLSLLHARRSPVLTLNYDLAIEAGVADHGLWEGGEGAPIDAADLLNGTPPLPPGVLPHKQLTAAFQLLKLHGSLDWYAVTNDTTGATLSRTPLLGTFEHPQEFDLKSLEQLVPGRETFIVPPSITKTMGYGNPIMRQVWRNAAAVLKCAKKVVLVGYSLPTADLVMRGMLEDCLSGRDVIIEVVNLKAKPVIMALESAGLGEHQIIVTEGQNCVETFTYKYRDQVAASVTDWLRSLEGLDSAEIQLHAPWGEIRQVRFPDTRRILAIEEALTTDSSLTLKVCGDGEIATTNGLAFGELLRSLGNRKSLWLTADAYMSYPVVAGFDYRTARQGIPRVTLVPAGKIQRR